MSSSSLKTLKFSEISNTKISVGAAFKGRVPPRFSYRRYQQILDLLATLIPTMYSKSHRSDENPAFDRVKVPASWSRSGSAPSCAGCPPQQQRGMNMTWPVRSTRSTMIHVFARKFAPANLCKPRHGKRV
ncbi:hypothetical protein Y032_0232g3032 [Ancylostoma ceylanicum]|uniref:Uncharacterized protein n=1 Tax=Ancylostoma ceylanicum TaxID=53326 RepID=A0A016SFK9_9BILA|nr:hypothetical protein Y032_0232g3032 [Ancylostoma ceylanicum]